MSAILEREQNAKRSFARTATVLWRIGTSPLLSRRRRFAKWNCGRGRLAFLKIVILKKLVSKLKLSNSLLDIGLRITYNYCPENCAAGLTFSRAVPCLDNTVKISSFVSTKPLLRCFSKKQGLWKITMKDVYTLKGKLLAALGALMIYRN